MRSRKAKSNEREVAGLKSTSLTPDTKLFPPNRAIYQSNAYLHQELTNHSSYISVGWIRHIELCIVNTIRNLKSLDLQDSEIELLTNSCEHTNQMIIWCDFPGTGSLGLQVGSVLASSHWYHLELRFGRLILKVLSTEGIKRTSEWPPNSPHGNIDPAI